MKPRTGVVIAGGGTGGHVVPGLAIARALVRSGTPSSCIHWVGSERGMEVDAVPEAGFGLTVLPGRGIERRFALVNVRNTFDIGRAVIKAFGVVRRLRPAVVVSLGGYAAVPASVAAVVLRIPIVIQEQNARASLANRLVSRFAAVSAVLASGTGLRHEVETGNPLREEIRDATSMDQETATHAMGVPSGRTVILVFGGSLGSLRINLATLELVEAWASRTDLAVHHVVGTRDWDELQPRIRALEGADIHYRAVAYEHKMAVALASADVAVCRSGGMTVSEISALGVPAILIPLPIAPNDAQRHNTTKLVEAGAAVVVHDSALDGARLGSELDAMLDGGLEARAEAARSVGRPDADEQIAALIHEVMNV